MGLLDDAIREHLDLKRRRGADPTEVARAEHEALGPVRREPTPTEAADDHDQPHHAAPEAHPDTGGHPADDHTRVLDPSERHEGAQGDPLRDEASRAPDEGGRGADEHDHAGDADADADRAGGVGEDDSATPLAESPRLTTGPARSSAGPEEERTEQQDPRTSDIVHQPTTEFRVEDHHDDDETETKAEDVLEETPDFLQETPEHDRLWFEQRPPRDFDFDG